MSTPVPSPQKASPASIELSISSDNLSAALTILPTSAQTSPITPEDILKLLAAQKIVSGIDENKIRILVNKFNASKGRIENEEIVRGKHPKPGRKGEFRALVPCITDKTVLDAIIAEGAEPHISTVLKHTNRVKGVAAGETFARRTPAAKGTPGEDIYGKPLDSSELLATAETLSPNVTALENGEAVRSNIAGIPVLCENKINVLPVDFNSRFMVEISPDRMEAKASLLPAGEQGKPLDAATVQAVLRDKKVSFGLDDKGLVEAVERLNRDKVVVQGLIIARGQPPINGANGRVDFQFQAEGHLKPKEMEDGSVNFKEITLIETVSEGQPLARVYPPTKGQPGHDVCGNTLPARDGAPAALPAGPNTGPDPKNPEVLIALKSGNVRRNGNVIEVSEGFVIPGNVDFSTGNIHYEHSVTVRGEIKSGFEVISGGDLEVTGLIEDSTVKAEGNVLIRGGFVGNGKGQLTAGGSVNVGFIRNQTIKSKANVVVAKEAMNAKIFAKNMVSIHGRTLSVVGGKISARNEIEGFVFGNDQGTKTEIEVGIDFTLVEEKYKSEEKIKELADNKKKVQENIGKFEKIIKIKKALPPKQEFLYKKLVGLMSKIDAQLSALEKRKEMIEKKVNEIGKARIVVKDRMMPGCLITIGDRHMAIQHEVVGPKSIMLIEGDIKIF